MDWWQTVSLMGTFVLASTAVATFGWRVLRKETDKLRERKPARARQDRRGDRLGCVTTFGGEIAQVRDDLRGEIAQLRDDLRGEIAQLREGQASSARRSGKSARGTGGSPR